MSEKDHQPGMRPVVLVMMKRKQIRLEKIIPWQLDYGHWWFEIGAHGDRGSESYGWWPKSLMGNILWKTWKTFMGTDGELNGQENYGGSSTTDPYHGDESASVRFHPLVAADDPRSDAEVAACLRDFAASHRGEWRWTFGFGRNCHSFQRAAMTHCRMGEP